MRKHSVVIADDDTTICHIIERHLRNEGFEPHLAFDGEQALRLIEEISPKIVILDIMMPKVDGLEALKRLRTWSSVPVIILSARSTTADKVLCISSGADDYMVKPFSLDELTARIDMILRRSPAMRVPPAIPPFRSGDFSIDYEQRKVRINGEEISLTPREYKIVSLLTRHAGKILSYEYILKNVWDNEYQKEKVLCHVHIRSIRSKIGDDAHAPRYIETISSVGYRFIPYFNRDEAISINRLFPTVNCEL